MSSGRKARGLPGVGIGAASRLLAHRLVDERRAHLEAKAVTLARCELDHVRRAAAAREAPGPQVPLDRDDAAVAVAEDDVDREAHEMRVDRAALANEEPF